MIFRQVRLRAESDLRPRGEPADIQIPPFLGKSLVCISSAPRRAAPLCGVDRREAECSRVRGTFQEWALRVDSSRAHPHGPISLSDRESPRMPPRARIARRETALALRAPPCTPQGRRGLCCADVAGFRTNRPARHSQTIFATPRSRARALVGQRAKSGLRRRRRRASVCPFCLDWDYPA